jgi:integrase
VVSLQTSDSKVAAPKVAQLVRETNEDWDRLRNPTRESVQQQARELLARHGIDPSNLEETPEGALWVFGYLLAFLGERLGWSAKARDIRSIKRSEVNEFVAWLLAGKHSEAHKGVSTSTVERYLRTLLAAVNRAIRENELGGNNVFADVEIPMAGADVTKRKPFTVDQHTATKGPHQLRCILTLVAETGSRSAEIVGLATADAHLHAAMPYPDLCEHPWRTLKTLGSVREVPLTPRALEAVQAALRLAGDSPFLCSRPTRPPKALKRIPSSPRW